MEESVAGRDAPVAVAGSGAVGENPSSMGSVCEPWRSAGDEDDDDGYAAAYSLRHCRRHWCDVSHRRHRRARPHLRHRRRLQWNRLVERGYRPRPAR